MAEQTDVRRSGRIARLEVRAPGTDDIAVLNFETGKARSERPVLLAAFAELLARFMVNLPEDLRKQLRERMHG
jgi:RecB family exonuclease